MNILALDLGTSTGYAYGHNDPIAGTELLATDKEIRAWGEQRLSRRCDPRIARLYSWCVNWVRSSDAPSLVVFEDVQFASYTLQVQLWASLRAAVWCAFSPVNVIFECVPVGTLKLFATGHGRATKEAMAAALYREHPEMRKKGYDDNAVDAIFLWKWAKHNLGRLRK